MSAPGTIDPAWTAVGIFAHLAGFQNHQGKNGLGVFTRDERFSAGLLGVETVAYAVKRTYGANDVTTASTQAAVYKSWGSDSAKAQLGGGVAMGDNISCVEAFVSARAKIDINLLQTNIFKMADKLEEAMKKLKSGLPPKLQTFLEQFVSFLPKFELEADGTLMLGVTWPQKVPYFRICSLIDGKVGASLELTGLSLPNVPGMNRLGNAVRNNPTAQRAVQAATPVLQQASNAVNRVGQSRAAQTVARNVTNPTANVPLPFGAKLVHEDGSTGVTREVFNKEGRLLGVPTVASLEGGVEMKNGRPVFNLKSFFGASIGAGGRSWQISLTNIPAHMPKAFV